MIPEGNSSNKYIKEKISKFWLKLGKNHIIKNTAIGKTDAITWFSVRLDANIPNDK